MSSGLLWFSVTLNFFLLMVMYITCAWLFSKENLWIFLYLYHSLLYCFYSWLLVVLFVYAFSTVPTSRIALRVTKKTSIEVHHPHTPPSLPQKKNETMNHHLISMFLSCSLSISIYIPTCAHLLMASEWKRFTRKKSRAQQRYRCWEFKNFKMNF